MVSTLDDTKRLAIATKLADMKALQNLLINNEEKFIQDCTDDDIRSSPTGYARRRSQKPGCSRYCDR
jgi:hypothetical protein